MSPSGTANALGQEATSIKREASNPQTIRLEQAANHHLSNSKTKAQNIGNEVPEALIRHSESLNQKLWKP
jgi:hypothetical protein